MTSYGEIRAALETVHDAATLHSTLPALQECHWLDFKAKPWEPKSGNTEAAKDLGMFAMDGGFIILGVNEGVQAHELWPTKLSGLPERIDQIASRLSPGINVTVKTVPLPDGPPDTGIAIIDIPPTGTPQRAPSGSAYLRLDRTSRVLADDEFLDLTDRRAARIENLQSVARELLSKTTPGDAAPTAIVAAPLVNLAARKPWDHLLATAPNRQHPDGYFARTFAHAGAETREFRVAHEVGAVHSFAAALPYTLGDTFHPNPVRNGLEQVREYRNDPNPAFEGRFALKNDGTVSVRINQLRTLSDVYISRQRSSVTTFADNVAVSLILEAVAAIEYLTEDDRYDGPWAIAFAATGLRGLLPASINRGGGLPLYPNGHDLNEDSFLATTIVSPYGLHGADVVHALIGDLLHLLGSKEYWYRALPPTG